MTSNKQKKLQDFDGQQSKLSFFIREEVNELEIQLAKKHPKKCFLLLSAQHHQYF